MEQLVLNRQDLGTCPVFTAALFTVAKMWKQLKCPSTGDWIKKRGVHIYNGILQSHKKE